jgi:hypothetical protein
MVLKVMGADMEGGADESVASALRPHPPIRGKNPICKIKMEI